MPRERTTEQAAAHDELSAVYAAQRQRLLRIAMAIVRQRADAEDAVQEAFLRAAGPILRGECDPERYLSVTVRNVALNAVRARRRESPPDPYLMTPEPSPETLAVQREALRGAWGALSVRDRLLLAHSFAGFAYDEIARRSQMSAKGVSVGLVRARDRARRWIDSTAGAMVLIGRAPHRLRHSVAGRLLRLYQVVGGTAPPHLAGEMLALAAIAGLAGSAAVAPVAVAAPSSRAAAVTAPATLTGRAGGAAGAAVAHEQPATPPPAAAAHGGGTRRSATGPTAGAPDVATSAPYMSSISVSPDYGADHTIFAAGAAHTGVLYRSSDGGATWARLPALGFAGGRIIFAPGWPADPRLFAGTTLGLQESDDGGRSFFLAAPVSGPIAVEPTPSGLRVVIAGPSLWTYDTATRTVTPGPLLPAGFFPQAVVPQGSTGEVLVGGARLAGTSMDGLLLHCAAVGTCTTTAVLSGSGGADLVAEPSGLVVLTNGGAVYRSGDGGATLQAVDTGGRHALDVAVGSGTQPLLAVSFVEIRPGVGGAVSRVAVAAAGMTRFAPLPAAVTTGIYAIAPLAVLPDGRILTVQTQEDNAPVAWYSDDSGASWARTEMWSA